MHILEMSESFSFMNKNNHANNKQKACAIVKERRGGRRDSYEGGMKELKKHKPEHDRQKFALLY